jgi:hypothetical protein
MHIFKQIFGEQLIKLNHMTCFTSQWVKPSRSGEGEGVSVTPVTYPSALTPVRTPVTSRTSTSAVSRRTSMNPSVVSHTVSNAARCVCVTEDSAGKTESNMAMDLKNTVLVMYWLVHV